MEVIELVGVSLRELVKPALLKISEYTIDTTDNLMFMDGGGFLLMDGSSFALEEQT